MMQEWQKHIERGDQEGTAWCGARVRYEWAFRDSEHALLTIVQGGRLRPCPECAREIKAVLDAGEVE